MVVRPSSLFNAHALGFGCSSLSPFYEEPPPSEEAQRLLLHALDRGLTHFDTAAIYGGGDNERLIGRVLASHRSRIVLATKVGMQAGDGRRIIDSRPERIGPQLEESLRRLRIEAVDLLYLHRWDKTTPIEESVGAMGELVRQGKVRALGLSEVSAQTLERAHAIHPIAALQSEYSLWTRNSEIAALDACRRIGATFVAFSPLGRGWLANKLRDAEHLSQQDIRKTMPRFQRENFDRNRTVLEQHARIARESSCTPAQLALAWLLSKHPYVFPIPGTRSIEHLDENLGACAVRLGESTVARLDQLFTPGSIAGARYTAATQAQVDTEEFAAGHVS